MGVVYSVNLVFEFACVTKLRRYAQSSLMCKKAFGDEISIKVVKIHAHFSLF